MTYHDFVIPYDVSKDTQQEVTKKIINSLYVKKLHGKKPVVTFISGDSGEGKSWAALKLMETILELQGVDMAKVNKVVNVHTPLQYPEKLRLLLEPQKFVKDPEELKLLKKTNVLCVHEARNLIKSKKWQEFTSQAVADVNAMSRAIKRIAFIIISQFIRDITSDVRYTLNYYCKCSRPINKRTKLYFNIMWKDDRDPHNPKLRYRKLCGYFVKPNNMYKKVFIDYFELDKPKKEITDEFDEDDFQAKGKIIHALMEKMISKLQTEFNYGTKKIDAMVKWYTENPDMLQKIGKTTARGKWKFKPSVAEMHDLTPTEFKDFVDMMNNNLSEMVKQNEPTEPSQ